LGPTAGPQRVEVRVGNPRSMPPFVITARAAAGAPEGVDLVSGAGQEGPVGVPLGNPVVVAVTDQYGNPVPGVAVKARPRDGGVADSVVLTDSAGRVAVRWTLGRRAGTNLLRLRAGGVDTLVTVVAHAKAAEPANLTFVRPPETAAAGRPLPLPTLVTDAYGNPVPDALVLFQVSAGTLSAGRVMSDYQGEAATHWTPANKPVEQSISATVRGTTVKTTHTLRLVAGKGKPGAR
jgi:adhesin/invasin